MSVVGGFGGSRARLAAVGAPPQIADTEIDDEISELEAISLQLETHTLADDTRRAYERAWSGFTEFCSAHHLDALPAHPDVVRWYVAWMSAQVDEWGAARFAIATIRQHLAGIAEQHLRDGHLDPTGHRSAERLSGARA